MDTAKEKAKELVEKYYKATYKDNRALGFNDAFRKSSLLVEAGRCGLDSIGRARECAIICVDEIIEVLGSAGVYSFADKKVTNFWDNVKKEIEKLKPQQ